MSLVESDVEPVSEHINLPVTVIPKLSHAGNKIWFETICVAESELQYLIEFKAAENHP